MWMYYEMTMDDNEINIATQLRRNRKQPKRNLVQVFQCEVSIINIAIC